MATFKQFTDGILSVINALSRFVGIAAPVASAVGEATGKQDVVLAANEAKKVADIATQATDKPGD